MDAAELVARGVSVDVHEVICSGSIKAQQPEWMSMTPCKRMGSWRTPRDTIVCAKQVALRCHCHGFVQLCRFASSKSYRMRRAEEEGRTIEGLRW